jgi:hypothetical protein
MKKEEGEMVAPGNRIVDLGVINHHGAGVKINEVRPRRSGPMSLDPKRVPPTTIRK